MPENKASRTGKGKLIAVWDCHRKWPGRRREPGEASSLVARRERLPSAVKALAVLAAVAIPLSMVQPTPAIAPVVSAAEQFGQAATAAFADSAAGLDGTLTSAERAAGLPVNPGAGLVSQSPAGAVDMVLPGGLGAGRVTSSGQMVYPDAGAGFDLLAENTRSGYRTVARIGSPDGVRSVTTLVRTPADTVMLMHSSGHLTLNRATEKAETLGVMSPAEARDATGRIVYSAYVAKQVAPQLYQVSEVISPTESTTWPVYVDPPISLGGNYSQFGWDDVDHTLDSIGNGFMKAGEAIGKAFEPMADGQHMQAQAMGDQVRQHPLESAMLVGSTALMATGVGSAAGAGVLARVSLTLNVASVGTEAVAATDPNNKGLQSFSAGMQILAAVTPQGLTKKTVESVAESAIEQGIKKGGDDLASEAATLTRVTPETATDATKLSQEVAAAGKNAEVPGIVPGGEHAWPLPPSAADRRLTDDINARVKPRADTKEEIWANAKRDPDTGQLVDPYSRQPIEGTPHVGHLPEFKKETADRMSEQYGLSRRERVEFEQEPGHYQLEHGPDNSGHKNEIPYRRGDEDKMYRDHYEPWARENIQTNPRLAQDPTAQRRIANMGRAPSKLPERPSSPADQRQVQQARAEQASQAQRSKALQGARMVNSVSQQQAQHNNEPQTVHARPESEAQQRDNQAVRNTSATNQTRDHAREGARPAQNTASTHNGNGSSHDSGSHSKNNGSKKNNKGNGKGNRAKRSRTGRH